MLFNKKLTFKCYFIYIYKKIIVMFLKLFSSFLADTINIIPPKKYKVLGYNIVDKSNTVVNCELIENGKNISLDLKDIVKNKLHYFCSADVLLLSELTKNKISDRYIYKTNTNSNYYNILAILFIVCLLISNLAATKLCNFFGYILPGGTIFFPLLYIINDILTEVYGFKASRKVIWLALACNLLLVMSLYLVVLMPSPQDIGNNLAFAQIFSLSPRILFASIISYFFGELANATIISLLKIKMKGGYFALRAITSTIIGSFLESIIFCVLAFINRMSILEIISMIVTLTIIKVLYELLVIPITTKIVMFLKTKEGFDIFEEHTISKSLFS